MPWLGQCFLASATSLAEYIKGFGLLDSNTSLTRKELLLLPHLCLPMRKSSNDTRMTSHRQDSIRNCLLLLSSSIILTPEQSPCMTHSKIFEAGN